MVSRCIATIDQERGIVHSVAVMKNKKQFVSATDITPNHETDCTWSIKLWDIETRQCVRTFTNFKRRHASRCSVFVVDDESFVCFFHAINVLVLYNIASWDYMKTIELDDGVHYYVTQLTLLDQSRFLTGHDYGDVKVWRIDTGKSQRTFALGDNDDVVRSLSKFDDESFLCGVDRKVLLCNVETGEVVKSFDVDGRTDHIAVVDSERFLTVQHLHRGISSCPSKVNAWNAISGDCFQRVSTDSNVVQAIPVRGHGFLLRYCNNANTELRGDEMRKPKRCFVGHKEEVLSVDLVSDTTFISWSRDGTIKLWDLSRWPDLKTLLCLRKLTVLGRAEKVSATVPRSKRLRVGGPKTDDCHEILPVLHALVCETSDDIFRMVLACIA